MRTEQPSHILTLLNFNHWRHTSIMVYFAKR